jgi:hypothetical protein
LVIYLNKSKSPTGWWFFELNVKLRCQKVNVHSRFCSVCYSSCFLHESKTTVFQLYAPIMTGLIKDLSEKVWNSIVQTGKINDVITCTNYPANGNTNVYPVCRCGAGQASKAASAAVRIFRSTALLLFRKFKLIL